MLKLLELQDVTPLDEIVGLNAFSLDRVLEVEPDFLESDHDHDHDDDITSILLFQTPLWILKIPRMVWKTFTNKGTRYFKVQGYS